jgi:hypothetical protein
MPCFTIGKYFKRECRHASDGRGEARFVLACGSPVIDLRVEGGDAVFIGEIGSCRPYAMTVPGIPSVEDLKNKPVGVPRFGSSSDDSLVEELEHLGLYR